MHGIGLTWSCSSEEVVFGWMLLSLGSNRDETSYAAYCTPKTLLWGRNEAW
jgi:hypothetical protein